MIENFQLEVGLIPAPDPKYRGHKVRQVITENPPFYKRMAARRNFVRGKSKKYGPLRKYVTKALHRIIAGGKDPRGLEDEVLEELQQDEDDMRRQHEA